VRMCVYCGGYRLSKAAATSVDSDQEANSWIKITLDEEQGRIFLEHVDGLITTGTCLTVNGNALSS